MKNEPEDLGFKVTDKRTFGTDVKTRAEATAPAPPEAPKSDPIAPATGPAAAQEPPPGTQARIDFPSYILSYYTQGLVFLGEVPNPMTNRQEQDLENAQHMVDILSMLQAKTKGNLTREEDQLLESVLYELRMKFMAKTNRIKL